MGPETGPGGCGASPGRGQRELPIWSGGMAGESRGRLPVNVGCEGETGVEAVLIPSSPTPHTPTPSQRGSRLADCVDLPEETCACHKGAVEERGVREALTTVTSLPHSGLGLAVTPAQWLRGPGHRARWVCGHVCGNGCVPPHTRLRPEKTWEGRRREEWAGEDRKWGQSQEDPSPRCLCSGPCFGSRVFSSPLRL